MKSEWSFVRIETLTHLFAPEAEMPNYKKVDKAKKVLGDFFEELALHLLGGELTGHSSDDGDLLVWDVGAVVEVKGSDYNHPFRLEVGQLKERLAKAVGFPFSHAVYLLCGYANRRDRKTGKYPLSLCESTEELRRFGADKLNILYFVDADLIPVAAGLGEVPVNTGTMFRKSDAESFDLNRTMLKGFANGRGPKLFSEIGGDWQVTEGHLETEFQIGLHEENRYRISAPATFILKPELTDSILSRVERQAEWAPASVENYELEEVREAVSLSA